MKVIIFTVVWVAFGTPFLALGQPIQDGEDKAVAHRGQPDRLATLRVGHPRLLLTPVDIEALRAKLRTDETLARWYAKVRRDAEQLIDVPPVRYEIPDGKRLLAVSRTVLRRTQTLGLGYLIDRDERFKQRLWKELDTAANFKDWNPRHFLDTAEMTHAFAIGYDWLHDVWSAEQRQALVGALVRHGLEPGAASYDGKASYGWFPRSHHNWNQVCNGGMLMGALAIADQHPQLARRIVDGAVKSLPLAMSSYAPDGAWGEGPGYWHYATRYTVLALAALESALGTDFQLADQVGFECTGDFPLQLVGPTGKSFNFGDGRAGPIRAPELFWLARRFQRPDYAARQVKFAGPEPLDIIWCARLDPPFPKTTPPLVDYFRRSEVVTMRSGWDRDAVFVGFKAGDNRFNHSNLDVGGFVLEADGVRWALDLGADNYNLPAYFGDRRWTYYRLRAEGHNTLVLNPSRVADQDPQAATKVVRLESNANRVEAVADLTSAYAGHARRVERTIAMIDGRAVEVRDRITTDAPADVWWFMHTAAKIRVEEDGRSAILSQNGRQLRAVIRSPQAAVFSIREAAPLPSSPNPKGQASNDNVRKLTIHQDGVKELDLTVRLEPVRTLP